MEAFEQFLVGQGFKKADSLDDIKMVFVSEGKGLRYYIDEESIGLHIYNAGYMVGDLTNLKEQLGSDISKLKVLYLAKNRFIGFYHPEAKNLQYLNISENHDLSRLGVETSELIEFNASYCNILRHIELNGTFNKLEKLDISFCIVSELKLPQSLPKLTYFNGCNNQLNEISSFTNIENLEYLDLSNNNFQKLDLELKSPKLSILNLSSNKDLISISKRIFSAKDSLESINLSNTAIDKDALKIFSQFKKLKEVRLSNTPFAEQYPEQVQVGWDAIKTLFSNEQIEFLHVKVLLLGNTNIGKSNLLYYWENGKQDTSPSNSTHGIVYKEISNLFKTQSGKEVILHIWDFGGQEYFHATHKLFFSGGAINILLWSPENQLREEQEDRCFELDYWLRCIEQLGYDVSNSLKSETLVIENKIDTQKYLATPINQEKYNKIFGEKIDFYYHSIALMPEGKPVNEPRRLVGLHELLLERITNKDFSRDISYERIYDKIKSLSLPIIGTKTLFSAKPTEEEIVLLRVFHNMGILLYFHDILPDLVFIKPEAFLNFLYSDLFGKDKNHKITEDKIGAALKESSFSPLLTNENLIVILKSFDLIFKINEAQKTFFVPQYLPKKPIWMDFFEEHHFRFPTVLIESDSYLMNLVMLKIFGEYGKSVKKEGKEYLFWNDGIVIEQELKGKKNILLIKFDRESQRIELYEDETNFELLKSVVDFVVAIPEKIRWNFTDKPKIDGNVSVPIGDIDWSHLTWETQYFDIRLSNDGKYFVHYRELIDARKGLNNYVRTYDKVKKEETYKPISVYKFNKYLPKNQQSEMKKLMISYSKKDLHLIEEFKKYLEPLIRDGIIDEPWYCTMLEAGQEWDKEIQDRLQDWCDIICFMCSPNSFSAAYIKEKEIKVAIDRFETKKDIMIVPIILEPFRWISNHEKYNLGRFTALPYTAKPVTDFKQRSMAWYIIGECLRVSILNNLKPEGDEYWAEKDDNEKLPKDVISYFERIVKGSLDI